MVGIGDDPDRLGFAGREVVGQDVESLRRFGLDPELLGLVETDRRSDEAGGHDTEDDDPGTEVEPRSTDHAGGDGAPDGGLGRLGGGGVFRARLGDRVLGLRDEGPEHLLAADREHGRQGEEDGSCGDEQADGRGDAQAAGAGDDREDEAEQGQDDGEVRCEDRRRGVRPGFGERGAVIGEAAQLLAVAGDEQQRVVRAGPEDEDADDARVELQVKPVADGRGHGRGESVGGADDDERQQPQDR